MKYEEMDKLARDDLERVLKWIDSDGQQTDAVKELASALETSPAVEGLIVEALQSIDFADAPAYTKYVADYLLAYASNIKAGRPRPYERSSGRKDDTITLRKQTNLPAEVGRWWGNLSIKERSEIVVSVYQSRRDNTP